MFSLERYAQELRRLHAHICPRQILGLRMGERAGEWFGLRLPQTDKRLIAFVEMDGCFADGVMVATGCSLGHRTMRLIDEGKIAVTFADAHTGRAVRLHPRADVRRRAAELFPAAPSRWHAQLEAYQVMPADALLRAREVRLALDLRALVSRNGVRVNCDACGEEILNKREVRAGGRVLCRSCANGPHYADAHDRAEPVTVEALPFCVPERY